jgi:glutathione S-transferase
LSRYCRRKIREGALGERLREGHFASGQGLAAADRSRLHFEFEGHYAQLAAAAAPQPARWLRRGAAAAAARRFEKNNPFLFGFF